MNKEVLLGKIKLKNPVLCASGCAAHGYELEPYTDISKIAAFSMKTVTSEPRIGNKPPRICEVDNGMLTSIGLQNPGIEVFIKEHLPQIKKTCRPDQIIISIGGNEIRDYTAVAEKIAQSCGEHEIAAVEVNGACPNVAHGGGVMSALPETMYQVVKAVKDVVSVSVIGKMNTNFSCYCDVAKAIQEAGAEAVYLVSTPMGMHIDIKSRKPAVGNIKAPVSGPAILPQSVLKTWDVYQAVDIPVIASGGIYTWEAAIEMMMAGASAVGIGSALFINPDTAARILDGMIQYCEQNQIESFSELVGCAHGRD
ncbi:Dihydroorotate dehydrogenase B (NAD(+))%2C catalytic subunit [uncultured Roseburia sp.]|uniref:Dihydroorotate dehydrogenase n=1 Tax=Brotonthovivens ammoniilytica TaxID=2981725 RepID=A0ABT2TJP2_9FIRM|nr:dihydroorotate dehydrogenase [Brotonthovivens ammoniilytica]MCU6762327.1 dihydroorotate dehydrogenase [Brotonthovivens ammoniilytica]SCI68112.1 Dihydroorotate dehydrogenase B (NAD(+))%2C catalytic subunit [uncultured Roseburia sp.]